MTNRLTALLTEPLVQAETNRFILAPMGILPFAMLLFLTAFEILVAFLQAYIFTILTGVYIGTSMEGHGGDEDVLPDMSEAGQHAELDQRRLHQLAPELHGAGGRRRARQPQHDVGRRHRGAGCWWRRGPPRWPGRPRSAPAPAGGPYPAG